MDATQQAREYFLDSYTCAQAVFKALVEHYDLEAKEMVYLAAGFGGGIGKQGMTCGCVSGAVMAIGAIERQREREQVKHLEVCYDTAGEFVKRFKDEFDSILCKELIGYDLSVSSELQAARNDGVFRNTCPDFVQKAVSIVLEMYE